MFNSPAAGRKTAGSAGSPPVAGVMKTPELNQVSQMMSSMGVGGALAPQQFGMVRVRVRSLCSLAFSVDFCPDEIDFIVWCLMHHTALICLTGPFVCGWVYRGPVGGSSSSSSSPS